MLSKSNIDKYYDENTRKSDLRNPYVYYLIRPISFLVMPLLVRMKTHPNIITISRLLIGLVLFFLILGKYFEDTHFFIVAIIYTFLVVLDYVDGNLARYFKLKSFYGKMFDGWIDTSLEIGLFISIGYFLGEQSLFWGLFVSFINLFCIWTSQRYIYVENIKLQYQKSNNDIDSSFSQNPKTYQKMIKFFFTTIENFKIVYFTLLFILCSIYGFINEWHQYGGFYLIFFSLIDFTITIIKSLKSFNVKYE